jgi:hypothetical protein
MSVIPEVFRVLNESALGAFVRAGPTEFNPRVTTDHGGAGALDAGLAGGPSVAVENVDEDAGLRAFAASLNATIRPDAPNRQLTDVPR